MSGPLAGKVCIVTGASRGIGKGIALQLGEAGATVYITGKYNLLVYLVWNWWRYKLHYLQVRASLIKAVVSTVLLGLFAGPLLQAWSQRTCVYMTGGLFASSLPRACDHRVRLMLVY